MISKKYKKIVAEKGKKQWLNRESNVKEFIKNLKKKFNDLKGLKVLDAGCAQGRDSSEINSYGIEVLGIDSNREFVAEAKKEHPEIKFDLGDITNLPYKSEEFDAVYCVNTLFYTDTNKSLRELERVLKKNGILFITLDEKIFNFDENKEIHSLDIENTLKILKDFEILSKKYKERIDETPFKHKHHFYEIVLLKK